MYNPNNRAHCSSWRFSAVLASKQSHKGFRGDLQMLMTSPSNHTDLTYKIDRASNFQRGIISKPSKDPWMKNVSVTVCCLTQRLKTFFCATVSLLIKLFLVEKQMYFKPVFSINILVTVYQIPSNFKSRILRWAGAQWSCRTGVSR